MTSAPRRVVVGISGASGVIYGIRLLEVLRQDAAIETHLVISPAGRITIAQDQCVHEVGGLVRIVAQFDTISAHQELRRKREHKQHEEPSE